MYEVRWSKKFDQCTKCESVNKPHHAHGLCERCRDTMPNRVKDRKLYASIIRSHGYNGSRYRLSDHMLYKIQNNPICFYCDKSLIHAVKGELQIDHVDPYGDNSDENLVISCRRCNRLKSQQTIETLVNFLERMTNKKVTFI